MPNGRTKVFQVFDGLIAIDGPDGAGKSTLSALLASRLKEEYEMSVEIIQPTQFHASLSARKLKAKLEASSENFDTKQHNAFYLDAMRANYEESVLPALRNGALVILDSSELRALAFMKDKGTPEAYADTLSRIGSGEITCGI